jgi:hypothetical protein
VKAAPVSNFVGRAPTLLSKLGKLDAYCKNLVVIQIVSL